MDSVYRTPPAAFAVAIEAGAVDAVTQNPPLSVAAAESAPCRDAAAMREALEDIRERLVASVHDGTIDPHEALGIVEAALSAPARNCDRFATAKEARAAFNATYTGPTSFGFYEVNFIRWLFAKEGTRQ